jgi:SAM-dependent methyltransferase
MRRPGALPVKEPAFDYESKRWGSAPVFPSPWYLQGLRLRYCLEDLAAVRGSCLDAGCGAGNMAKAIKRARPDLEVTGVDASRGAIAAARAASEGVRFEAGDVQALELPASSFDAVVMFDVLEHLERPEAALAQVARVLKPGGLFHLALPLEDQRWTLHRFLRRRGWSAKLRHSGHIQAFDAGGFAILARSAGLEVRRVRFSAHPLLTLADVAYYAWLDLRGGSPVSLDDEIAAGRGPGAALMRALEGAVAATGWWESRLLGRWPGTCGHFTCVKRA